MKNKKRVFGLLIILLGIFGAAAFALQTSAADLLTQSLERLEAAQSGHAIVDVTMDSTEFSGSGTVEVWGQLEFGPNGEPAMRVEVLASSMPEMVGTTAVSDGTQFWLYNPAEYRVIVGTFEEVAEMAAEKAADSEYEHEAFEHEGELPDMPENAEEAVDLLLEYFNAERNGRANIGRNNANVVRLVPIPEQMPDEVRAAGGFVNVWIRRDDTAPLGAEYVEGAVGSARAEVSTLELDISIDPATFTFEIPEGAEVVHFSELEPERLSPDEADAAVDFALLEPTAVPDGAILRETTRISGAIVQRYGLADGASFTFAQGRGETAVPDNADVQTLTLRGVEATLYTDADQNRTLLLWSENGLNYWIGGDLTPEQAIDLAESLQ